MTAVLYIASSRFEPQFRHQWNLFLQATLELLKDLLEQLRAIRIVGLIKVDCRQDY